MIPFFVFVSIGLLIDILRTLLRIEKLLREKT